MKKAIVAVSFGTADLKVKAAVLDIICAEIQREFYDYDVVQAFTSVFMLKKIQAKGVFMEDLPTCLQRLHMTGYTDVIVQPLHFTPGEEYKNKIQPACESVKPLFESLSLGEAVVQADADVDAVSELLAGLECGEVVYMGHGSPNQHNDVYERLQRRFDELGASVSVGVLEENDYPNLNDVILRLKARQVSCITLKPLLTMAGSHVLKDMAGDSENSWQNRLKNAGFNVRVDKLALAELAEFRALYRKKIFSIITR